LSYTRSGVPWPGRARVSTGPRSRGAGLEPAGRPRGSPHRQGLVQPRQTSYATPGGSAGNC